MIDREWDDLSESEQLIVVGFYHCAALAASIAEQLGDDHVKGGLFWATHKSSPQFAEEEEFHDGGVGQYLGDWYVGFNSSEVSARSDDSEEISVVILVGDAEPGLETDLDTLLEVAESVFKTTGFSMNVIHHEYNSPGGDA